MGRGARQGEVLRRFTECQKCRISAAPANGSEQRLVVPLHARGRYMKYTSR
jgi:hypothetical protein